MISTAAIEFERILNTKTTTRSEFYNEANVTAEERRKLQSEERNPHNKTEGITARTEY